MNEIIPLDEHLNLHFLIKRMLDLFYGAIEVQVDHIAANLIVLSLNLNPIE
jgi:hypothetical protein